MLLIRAFFHIVLSSLLLISFLFSARVAAEGEADVRLVIDISGSMKRNDPQNLRQPAVNLLMELLPEAGHAGVWTFGKDVNMLVPFGEVNAKWRETARQKAGDINSVGLYTNIGSALEKAATVRPANGQKAHIILLTDGMVDIDKDPAVNQKEWRRIVDKILPLIKDQGFVVHTVALSDNADTHLMRELSLATNGQAAVAKTADDLMPAFLKAFDAAAPAQQVPLSGNGFLVDSSVEEFTALMFRDAPSDVLALVGPDNQPISAGNTNTDAVWHHTDTYDLVTIKRPLEGEWTVDGKLAKGSRITVVSDLNLRVKPLPISTAIGGILDLQLAVQESDSVVTRKDFLQLLTITAENTPKKDTKPSWQYIFNTSAPPANGVFTAQVNGFNVPGEYLVQVVLDGKTFKRRFAHQLSVNLPFDGALTKQQNDNSQLEYVLTVNKNAQQISIKNTQMAVTVTTPDRRKSVQPMPLNATDEWQYKIVPTLEGQYHLEVKVSGVDDSRQPFEYVLDDFSFQYSPGAEFESLLKPASSSSASSESTESSAASSVAESVADEPKEDEQEAPALSPFIIYGSLIAGNLLLLLGGLLIFKKMFGGTKEVDVNDAAAETPTAVKTEELAPDPEELDESVMEMESLDDEIPPMEDLEPDLDFDEDETDEPAAQNLAPKNIAPKNIAPQSTAPQSTAVSESIDENFDFDLSALKSATPEQPSTPPAVSNSDAQQDEGLGLAEDELDDAISNLIDELDDVEEGKSKPEANSKVGEINLDDFDFGDDDEFK